MYLFLQICSWWNIYLCTTFKDICSIMMHTLWLRGSSLPFPLWSNGELQSSLPGTVSLKLWPRPQLLATRKNGGENVGIARAIYMFHVWTEKFDTKIQPNVDMVDIPVPWILWEDVWKDVCVWHSSGWWSGCWFFCFRNGHLTSIENPPTCCFAQRSIKHTGGFARNFVYTWFVAGS